MDRKLHRPCSDFEPPDTIAIGERFSEGGNSHLINVIVATQVDEDYVNGDLKLKKGDWYCAAAESARDLETEGEGWRERSDSSFQSASRLSRPPIGCTQTHASLSDYYVPIHNIFPREMAVIGRLLVDYGELELDLMNCVQVARSLDLNATLKAMFRVEAKLTRSISPMDLAGLPTSLLT